MMLTCSCVSASGLTSDMNASQRKRRTTGSPPGSRSKSSRAASRNANANASRESDVEQNQNEEQTETISVLDQSVEDVVDLTCEEAAVVDLTHNDSVLLVEEGPQNRRTATGESYVVSSDEDEATPPSLNATTLSSIQANSATRLAPGVISCPVCMDSYSEIVESGRLVVSTKCGHVFCSQCLRDALTSSHTCPTCRKRLTSRQYHPLYI
ncbi:RING finger protein 4 [Scomber japonicus]|uniref:RING finger protein 4 n=1 Tax=Scomber japonicus TaxID=13676 RepID=UPI00230650D7|nr:RING finger protein 4 [Scomber japonicus]